jgi:hypothetical protein
MKEIQYVVSRILIPDPDKLPLALASGLQVQNRSALAKFTS